MDITQAKIKFSGHQTFSLRYGWLEKGFAFALAGNKFSAEDALVTLGVGKNMVASVQYWCRMFGILDVNDAPTEIALCLLKENDGWDPYLEDDASWWLLHWQLISNLESITSATVLFSGLKKSEFSKTEIRNLIFQRYEQDGGKSLSQNIVDRDVDCYVRTYCPRISAKTEDFSATACPLQNLHLIEQLPSDANTYRFNIGLKHSLPLEILGYALQQQMKRKGQTSIRLQEALYDDNSPGQVFMLDENSLVDAIEQLKKHPQLGKNFDFVESAGIARIHCTLEDAMPLLKDYYTNGSMLSWTR